MTSLKLYVILILCLLFRCTETSISNNSKQDTNDEIKYVLDSLSIKENVIFEIICRMDAGKSLSEVELDSLCTFVITNKDEGCSEGVGNALFRYYQRNNDRCETLKRYLKKNNKRKIIENKLIMYFCVDMLLEGYNQEKMYMDFIFLEQDKDMNNVLSDCLNN